jgi:hypothetical protein
LRVEAVGIGLPAGHTVMNDGAVESVDVTLTMAAVAPDGAGETLPTSMATLWRALSPGGIPPVPKRLSTIR